MNRKQMNVQTWANLVPIENITLNLYHFSPPNGKRLQSSLTFFPWVCTLCMYSFVTPLRHENMMVCKWL